MRKEMSDRQKAAKVARRLLGQPEPKQVHRVKRLPVDYEFLVDNFPSIDKTGSVSGMKKQYWGKDALCVRCRNYIYNVTSDPHIYNSLAT